MTIAAAPARQTDRSASVFTPAYATTAKTVSVPVQVPPATVVSEGLGKDALISWFRGEFAAANAIIDAMCSHLRIAEEAVSGSEYEAVFAAIHRRRLNWIPVLQMQKYHSIAEVAIELQKVAAKKAEDLKQKKTEEEAEEDLKEVVATEEEEVKKECFNGEKVTENDVNGDVEDVEDDSPTSDITDSGSHQDVHQTVVADTAHQIICHSHEDCDARSCEIKPIKGFQAKEQVKGHTVNVVKGLKLYEELLKEDEISKLLDFVAELREAGINGKLAGESFILFNKQIKGNKRELIQLGVPIFGHVKADENSNDTNNSVNIEPIPPLLESVIDHFVTWRLIPEYKRPNGCVINFFEEGEYSQPFLKPPHLEQPISTLVLSESTMAYGRILSSDNEGNFRGPLTLSLKQGSLLVMRGNSADMARHVMCPSQNKRVSITFFRIRPDTYHNHSQPNSPRNDGVMTMWQPYQMTPTPFLNGYDHSIDMMPKLGVLRPPMVMMAPPPVQPMILPSPNVMGTGGGTGVFLPWASVNSSRKHVKHLPPRAQKKRLLPLPPAASSSPAGGSTSEPVITVG
ncbi:unnamed protein product [Arabidopsis thaliana]|uniref:Fe2OG dioxygenase domain-containing protein n=1 Tax=Arabidopsis thaliana TaxID=3702 RepID=A0A654FLE6_ARATH|nr:unnamed protein product [Arabidopsis thaliana]VYS61665.1 unnamed protein product [Arabidopsis thaliana]